MLAIQGLTYIYPRLRFTAAVAAEDVVRFSAFYADLHDYD